MVWCRQRKSLKNENEENLYRRWEQDNDLAMMPVLGLFEEYLEMGQYSQAVCLLTGFYSTQKRIDTILVLTCVWQGVTCM